MSLDLGNNRLGDRGGYQIIDALVEPDPDLLLRQELGVDSSDDEPADGEGDSRPPSRAGAGRSASTAPSPAAGAELDGYVELPPVDRTRCNGSLTALSLQSNDVAQRSMNRLAQLLKTNRTLGKLDVAFNPRLGAAETRQVCAMIRLYNDCLGSLAIGQLPMGDELASAVGKAVQASARAKARLPSPLALSRALSFRKRWRWRHARGAIYVTPLSPRARPPPSPARRRRTRRSPSSRSRAAACSRSARGG